MKGTELVLKALIANGVKFIFGYTGGAIMPIFDEMEKQKALSFIMSRHEQGAVFMAQGISRASLSTSHPRTGVCMATSGPGAMNLVTGIADANMDSVPVLAVTGQVATAVIATDAFQESDVVGVMMPLTKQTYMPLSVDDIETTIHEAMYVASTGRGGPVVVDIPKDVQLQETDSVCEFDPRSCEPQLPGFYYSPSVDRDALKAGRRFNQPERASHHPQRPRRHFQQCRAETANFCGEGPYPGGLYAAWTVGAAGGPPGEPGHGGYARDRGSQPGPDECRSDHFPGHALR
jgi:acetolactate synthase-1/2/3 large subunit